jgi:hypothetical protein
MAGHRSPQPRAPQRASPGIEVSGSGDVKILATMPLPADGGVHTPAFGFAGTLGIVGARDRTLYFLYAAGTAVLMLSCDLVQ